jgi:hypothetical protein
VGSAEGAWLKTSIMAGMELESPAVDIISRSHKYFSLEDISKSNIVGIDPDKINYDDKEEVQRILDELKIRNKALSDEKLELEKKKKRLENELRRRIRKESNQLNAQR